MTGEDESLQQQFRGAFVGFFAARKVAGKDSSTGLGLAVSGGSDSMAMLHLAAQSFRGTETRLSAVTVNHGLRPEAVKEARFVADACAALEIPHATLDWQGWDGGGNLQDQARRARYRLIRGWARDNNIDTVCIGHTMDDQAETVLMQIARSAGVDGLAGMSALRKVDGVTMLRPLLNIRRQVLRDYLKRNGLGWVDDPSNEDEKFDRIKARKALAALASLGIDANCLSDVAENMADAMSALQVQCRDAAAELGTIDRGDVSLDSAGLADLTFEIRRRLLVQALKWVSSAEYPPRRDAMIALEIAIFEKKVMTLHGCQITPGKDTLRISREPQAVKDAVSTPDGIWDNRWRLSGPETKGAEVRMLGETGLLKCADWRETGLPRASLIASPAVWVGAELVAAPLAGLANGWTAELLRGEADFFASVLSH